MGLKDQFSIKDKVIIITGGEGVIGSSLALSFAAEGAKIAIIGIEVDRGKEIQKKISDSGHTARFYTGSVLDKNTLVSIRESIQSDWGHVDVLINVAGGNKPGATTGPDKTVFDLDINDFKDVIELNLDGTVIPSIVFGELMAENKEGVIINFSSMAAQLPLTRIVGYSAAKAAINNYTRWMAVEMAKKYGDGIRVNAIAPGFLVTKQNRDLLLNKDNTLTERGNDIIRQTPFGRFGEPDELTGTILWLCSDASRFVTGAVIPVDGGFSAFSGV